MAVCMDMSTPTYQELIEMLSKAESETADPHSVLSTAEALTTSFTERYPHIPIGRPGRFLATVQQINSPLKRSKWSGKVTKEAYLKKEWSPRVRNKGTQPKAVEEIPDVLTKYYGLTMESLIEIIQTVKNGSTSNVLWTLHGIPKVGFYRNLHTFLKKWKVTCSLPKTTIGKIYLSIDDHLQSRGSTAYNTYRFIEKLMVSDVPDSAIMSYGADKSLRAECRHCSQRIDNLDIKLMKQQEEIAEIKNKLN